MGDVVGRVVVADVLQRRGDALDEVTDAIKVFVVPNRDIDDRHRPALRAVCDAKNLTVLHVPHDAGGITKPGEAQRHLFHRADHRTYVHDVTDAVLVFDDDEDADLKQKRFNFLGACQAAAFLGTLQASYTQTGYLGDVSKRIIERDALIGVSMTGIMHDPKVVEHKNFLLLASSLIRQENELTAQKIGINKALRCTTIKPSGNSSTVAGCCAGIHPYHAKHYIRRMRINKINPIWHEILSKLPQVCDDSDSQVGIVAFACEAPDGAILR